jgi:hypothetical protein
MLCTENFFAVQWFYNGTSISGATSQCYTPIQDGSYTVQVTDQYGCSQLSPVYNRNTTGVKNVNAGNGDINLYPNPASSVLHIDAPVIVNISILNLQGQIVLHQENATAIDISSLANGVYMILVYDEASTLLKTERMVKNGL